MFKDWEKANSKNFEFEQKRTSIKRLYDLLELNVDNDKISYNDIDPSFEYTIIIQKNNQIKAGKYNISKTIEFDWNDDSENADSFNVYTLSLRDTQGNFSHIENTHKNIPLLVKFFKKFLQ